MNDLLLFVGFLAQYWLGFFVCWWFFVRKPKPSKSGSNTSPDAGV